MYELNGFGLELVGRCNASCTFCSWSKSKDIRHKNVFTGEEVVRSKGKISLDLVDKIFEIHNPKSIIFTGVCEPLLAPDRLFYVADKLEAKGGGAFAVFTDGLLLKDTYIRKLMEYGSFRSLNMSLNAATDETRKDVMGLPLQVSEENLLSFLNIRRKVGREDNVRFGCGMILTDRNRGEEVQFRQKWEERLAGYKNCSAPGLFLPTNWNGEVDTSWVKLSGIQYCNQWDMLSPTISVDGEIYLCCYSSHLTFGSCLDEDAVDKWIERKKVFNVGRENSNKPPPK